ncbi:hypothetical protein, partial [Bradyrhizobium sp.]|uniref:hypothetical protein n=1 Tax=Bradyrhizobium sp. TaxID=376 RepID=UPI00391D14EB
MVIPGGLLFVTTTGAAPPAIYSREFRRFAIELDASRIDRREWQLLPKFFPARVEYPRGPPISIRSCHLRSGAEPIAKHWGCSNSPAPLRRWQLRIEIGGPRGYSTRAGKN